MSAKTVTWTTLRDLAAELDLDEWMAVREAYQTGVRNYWESLRDWFSERGYTLYKLTCSESCSPSMDTPVQVTKSPEWPYAFISEDLFPDEYSLMTVLSEKVCFAQDRDGRHVAIKRLGILDETEDELRIHQFLFEHQEEAVKNCILPIIDILKHQDYCFAIMPRWGEIRLSAAFNSMGEVLDYIHCLLKAVNYLHSNSIVHRDIKRQNTLVNHFGIHSMRENLRSQGKLTYALFDFDLSLMLPSKSCKLPADRSWDVMIYTPFDTCQGELDYDPFILEMGTLGIMLCERFQHCIPSTPFLAPFLDKLITDKLDERFTSSEALEFFEKMYEQLTPEELSAPFLDRPSSDVQWEPEKYDRWKKLPEEFVKKWGHFRAMPPSMYTRCLRRICISPWGLRCVRAVRRFLRHIRSVFSNQNGIYKTVYTRLRHYDHLLTG